MQRDLAHKAATEEFLASISNVLDAIQTFMNLGPGMSIEWVSVKGANHNAFAVVHDCAFNMVKLTCVIKDAAASDDDEDMGANILLPVDVVRTNDYDTTLAFMDSVKDSSEGGESVAEALAQVRREAAEEDAESDELEAPHEDGDDEGPEVEVQARRSDRVVAMHGFRMDGLTEKQVSHLMVHGTHVRTKQ